MSGNYKTYQRRGLSIVWTAILLIVFLGLLGLGIDWGYVYLTAHQLQNAADASSLAGARYVREDLDLARQRTIEIAGQNTAAGEHVILNDNPDNDVNGDIVVGCYVLDSTVAAENRFTPMGVNDCTSPNAVRTVARRVEGHTAGPVGLFFGPIFGKQTANVAREAIAIIGADSNPGTIVTDPTGNCALNMGGNTNLSIVNGDLQVNSNHNCAMCVHGGPHVSADNINIVGDGPCSQGGGNAQIEGNVNTGAPPIPDPLCPVQGSSNCYPNPFETNQENWDWCLCAPEVPSIVPIVQGDVNDAGNSSQRVNVSNSNSPVVLQPGYYPQGIRMNGGHLTLLPGTYYIGRGGVNPSPNAGFIINGGTVVGHEVTLYLAATPSDPGGSTTSAFCNANPGQCHQGAAFEVGANTNITLSPPLDGEFQYVTVFQGHNNTRQASMSGGPGVNVEGIMYFPSTEQLELIGGAGGEFSNLIITNRLSLSGNISMNVQYTGLFQTVNYNVFIVR